MYTDVLTKNIKAYDVCTFGSSMLRLIDEVLQPTISNFVS